MRTTARLRVAGLLLLVATGGGEGCGAPAVPADAGAAVEAGVPDAAIAGGPDATVVTEAAPGEDQRPAERAAAADAADARAVDPALPCAPVPAGVARGPHPDDILFMTSRAVEVALGAVAAVPGTAMPDPLSTATVDLQVEDAAGSGRLRGARITVQASEERALPGLGYRGYFHLAPAGAGHPLYREIHPQWRLDAGPYPAFVETVAAFAAYLRARPLFTDTLVHAAAIVEATVSSVKPGVPWHCSTSDYTAVLHVERAMCGMPAADLTIYVAAFEICGNVPSMGPQPKLMPGQRWVFVLRRPEPYKQSLSRTADPSIAGVIARASDVRAPTDAAWQELLDLRATAAR